MMSYFISFGDEGRDVGDLQRLLFQNGATSLMINGKFDAMTHIALKKLQRDLGIEDDGVYGNDTQTALLARNPAPSYKLTKPASARAPAFPAKPANLSAPSLANVQSMFGTFNFEPGPVKDGHRWIVIKGDWEAKNIVSVPMPQMAGMYVAGKLRDKVTFRVHKLIANQTKALFAAWAAAGLMPWVLTYEGSFAPRLKKGAVEYKASKLSNHAWGTAFDINASHNPFNKPSMASGKRGDVRELVALANQHGFYWGGHFGSPEDGMHFECAKIIA
jgi:hypothetical protein